VQWRFGESEEGLWRDILEARYGSRGTWKLLWVREINLCGGKICVGYVVKEYKVIDLFGDMKEKELLYMVDNLMNTLT